VIPALAMLGYTVALAFLLPVPLGRLTSAGVHPRLGIIAWLISITATLASALGALSFLVGSAVAGWPSFARTFCRSVAGASCTPQVYRSALFELSLAVAALVVSLAAVVVTCRYGRSLLRSGRATRQHAQAARITGRTVSGSAPAGCVSVVLDRPEPAVYCVPGKPATIVMTSGALSILRPDQLSAILSHEQAHLAGRHHLLVKVTRCLATSVPVPVFTKGSTEVARLTEMRADDVAARRSGVPALLAALLAMATGGRVPGPGLAGPGPAIASASGLVAGPGLIAGSRLVAGPGLVPEAGLTSGSALAATGGVISARVLRLAQPPTQRRRFVYAALLVLLLAALVAVPLLLP
jgi:Zn-dependent protease with chaperone function